MSYPFPSQDIKQNVLLSSFLFRQLMDLGFIFHHPLKQWPKGRKKGRTEIQTFEYLENEKSILDEIKSFCIVF